MMTDLLTAQCKHYGNDTPALDTDSADNLLEKISDWAISEDHKKISRCFDFKNYYQTIAFVNASAWISHEQDHHPDLEVSYNRCHVNFSTHSVGGLSLNDFICAAKFNALFSSKD